MSTLPDAPSPFGNDKPLYNIGVVTRITGISMATLRAWERRYNFPEAQRTMGGHRLYSDKDVVRLKWVKERISEGMQTAQAIQALRHQEEKWNKQGSGSPVETIQNQENGKNIFIQYQKQLVGALLNRRLDLADYILGEALATLSPEDLILRVISPAMAVIGAEWEQERINVVTEHLATNYLRQHLLAWMNSGAPPLQQPPIVLACAPGEWHEGSLLILGALLRRRRLPVVYLGQNVPLGDLATFVGETKPDLIILIAMMEETAAQLIEWPQWLPDALLTGKPIIGFGGRVFSEHPEWRTRIPGLYLGSSIDEGIHTIESLLQQQ